MSKKFEQMNKAELLKAITQLKLQDKVEELKVELGKDDDSLVNADYIKVLNDFKVKQDKVNGIDDNELSDNESSDDESDNSDDGSQTKTDKVLDKETLTKQVTKNSVPKTREEEIQLAAEYNFVKSYVVVTDHDNTQSTDSDDLLSGVRIQWGNRFILGQTDVVFMHGEPQYVRNGALEVMKTILIPTNSENSTTRTKKRFSITEVEGWDQDRIDALKEQQKLKRL